MAIKVVRISKYSRPRIGSQQDMKSCCRSLSRGFIYSRKELLILSLWIDPSFRLERIYIKYLTQCRNWEGARDTWRSLIPTRGDSNDFWLRYYLWEMSTWGKLAYNENGHNAGPVKPSEATKVSFP